MTTGMNADRTLPGDWYTGTVPANVAIADSAYVETAFSFLLCRSERAEAVTIGHGASLYLGSMFDVGPQGRITIGRGAWIGFDCCVLPGVTIGAGSVVGARSVVTSDVEPFTIVAGNPARMIRRFTDEEMAHGR